MSEKIEFGYTDTLRFTMYSEDPARRNEYPKFIARAVANKPLGGYIVAEDGTTVDQFTDAQYPGFKVLTFRPVHHGVNRIPATAAGVEVDAAPTPNSNYRMSA